MYSGSWAPFLLVLFILLGCNNQHPADTATKNTIRPVETVFIKQPTITYHTMAVNHQAPDTQYNAHLSVILALNRIDLKHWRRVDSLVIPNTFYTDFKMYSPFPLHLAMLEKTPKLVFYSYRIQAFAAYENGELVRWGPVSMGKETTPTPTGLFHTNWKSPETRSTVNDEWIMKWYFNLENKEGVSMHEYELPGYPASHACVRLSEPDAMWFYHWCSQWQVDKKGNILANGTPVLIFGVYHFDRQKPWLALALNNKANAITETELETELKRFNNL